MSTASCVLVPIPIPIPIAVPHGLASSDSTLGLGAGHGRLCSINLLGRLAPREYVEMGESGYRLKTLFRQL